MKYLLIFISALFVFAFCSNKKSVTLPASTWAATGSNELVSFNALRDALLTGALFGGLPDGSNEMITKSDLLQWVSNVNPDASSISSMANNKLPTKQQIIDALFNNSISVRFRSDGTWIDCGTAANGSGGTANTLYFNGGLGMGTKFRSTGSLLGADPFLKQTNETTGIGWSALNSSIRFYEVTAYCAF